MLRASSWLQHKVSRTTRTPKIMRRPAPAPHCIAIQYTSVGKPSVQDCRYRGAIPTARIAFHHTASHVPMRSWASRAARSTGSTDCSWGRLWGPEVGKEKSRMPPQERGTPSLLISLTNSMVCWTTRQLYASVGAFALFTEPSYPNTPSLSIARTWVGRCESTTRRKAGRQAGKRQYSH